MKKVIIILLSLCVSMVMADVTSGDVITDMAEEDYHSQVPKVVKLPENFDVEAARAELKEARMSGDKGRAAELSLLIHTWWELNRDFNMGPEEQGSNPDPGPSWRDESHAPDPGPSPLWGNDVQIDPNSDVRPVKIAATSTGELYAFSVWDDGTNHHGYIRRSTDNGLTWSTFWDNPFATTTYILSPGIMVGKGDTLIYWYILDHYLDDEMRTWVKVTPPGTYDNPVYYGSPTGGFNPVDYSDLHLCTDVAVWPTEAYIYATWTERYGTGPDSTRTMNSVSEDNDVGSWEIGPTVLRTTSGANIYYSGTRIAYGSSTDMMWAIAWLHPSMYPGMFDRNVRGVYSDDYGSSWSDVVNITPFDNYQDEYDPAIAGSHANTNWVVLATQVDTMGTSDRDVNNWYSTDDGTNWTYAGWVSNELENFLGDVWVDNNSTAFYGVLRQDDLTFGDEFVRYKQGDINDPTTWTESVPINDDPTDDLSGVYGTSVTYNYHPQEACIAWNSFEGAVYTIWFDTYSGVGIEERPGQELSSGFVSLAPNPSKGSAQLCYVIQNEGNVKISLYDATGRLVNNLVNETKQAGEYSLTINEQNLVAGVYFIRVEIPEGVATKQMTIIR